MSTIRRKLNDVLILQRLAERVESRACRNLPQLHSLIGTGTGENLSIRAEVEIKDRSVMTEQRPKLFSRFNIPENDFLIVAGRCENVLIPGKHSVVHRVAMPFERRQLLAVVD